AGTIEFVTSDILRACPISRRVDPLHSGTRATRQVLGEAVRDAFERISDQVQTDGVGEHFVVRLAGMKVPHTADLPTVSKDLRTMGRARNVIAEGSSKEVPSVEIGAAVIGFEVLGIIQNGSAVLADLVESVRPGVSELRSKSVP